jgi:PAS domain S-box-containing protein
LGKGHLDERINLPPGDEVGDLALAFNRMAADIQDAIQHLQTSEAGYRDLLTAASAVGEGIALICDEGKNEGQFLFVNEAFAQLAGFDPPDLLHVNAATILHPDSLPVVRAAWERIHQGKGQHPYEITLVDRHGRSHILETAGTLIEYQGHSALAWFTRDISRRKAREDELRRRNRELTALNAVSSAAGELLPADALLERALRQVLTALSLDVGWILLQDAEARLQVAASAGIETRPLAFNFPNCLCGQVLQSGQPVVVRTTDSGCLVRRTLGETAVLPTCHATVPLRARGHTLGILSVAADNPRLFTEAEMGLLTAVGQQIGVALDNARLWQELQRKEQIRSELLARVIGAQEEERQRIARELHDGIGQSLNAFVFGLNTISTTMTAAPDAAPEMVQRLKISASDTVKELQSIIYDLRPSLLDDLGLVLALRWYARERLEPRQIAVTISVPDEAIRLPPQMETALFRVGQEAMTNVVKHARATAVDIQLTLTPQQVCMEIVDDGVGFEWEAEKLGENGRQAWGLLGIQERASLLGGRLDIETAPGRGAHLCVTLPLEGEVT